MAAEVTEEQKFIVTIKEMTSGWRWSVKYPTDSINEYDHGVEINEWDAKKAAEWTVSKYRQRKQHEVTLKEEYSYEV